MLHKINEIDNSFSQVSLIARVEKVIYSTATNGSSYIILYLADDTGRIECRKWTTNEEDKVQLIVNNFVQINDAVVNEYRGAIQLKISAYNLLDEIDLKQLGINKDDFFIKAPVDIEKDFASLNVILNGLKNNTYKNITLSLIEKHKKKFLTYPAAMSIHHNVKGGLFWHSVSLVKNAIALQETYKYASIDWELLICGAILHDIGKVIEINDVSASDYTLQGKVLGHISIGNTEINKMAEELGLYYNQEGLVNDEVTLLQHMVIASHGKKDYGSPIEPAIIEAIILSMLDDLDAKIFKVNDELKKVDSKSWTQRIPSVDNKMFYKHKK